MADLKIPADVAKEKEEMAQTLRDVAHTHMDDMKSKAAEARKAANMARIAANNPDAVIHDVHDTSKRPHPLV